MTDKKQDTGKIRAPFGAWRKEAIKLALMLGSATDQSKPQTLDRYLRSFESFMRYQAKKLQEEQAKWEKLEKDGKNLRK